MSYRSLIPLFAVALIALVTGTSPIHALESDRQQPLEVDADDTEGSLGDGTTVLNGSVEIRQGSLHIQADRAEVDKREGKVHAIVFRGAPARLEQEIEEQGLVQAEASVITYSVAAGKVELEGGADVNHPQYQISGERLTYDLDAQHFEGTSADSGDGRVRIRLEPEVAEDLQSRDSAPEAAPDGSDPASDDGDSDGTQGAP